MPHDKRKRADCELQFSVNKVTTEDAIDFMNEIIEALNAAAAFSRA